MITEYAVYFPGKTWRIELSSELEALQLKLLVEYVSDNHLDFSELFKKYGAIE